jgi:chromosome segregation ATPase
LNQQLEIDWGDESPFALSPDDPLPGDGLDADVEGFLEDVLDPALVHGSKELLESGGTTQEATYRRIRQLEKALEQCQHYIYELKSQMVDQAFLEAQLAATEEFSHIQKQAIVTLKGRQSSQAQLDQTELDHLRQENLALTAQIETVAGQSESQSSEINQLQDQLRQERASVKQMREEAERLATQNKLSQGAAVQETQQRIIAQTTAERLRNALREHEVTIQSLEAQLKQAHTTLAEQQEIIDALKTTNQRDSHKNQAIQNLSSTLLKAQTKISELESNLSSAGIVQAQFQHSTQEYEAQTQTLQERSEQLEEQVAEMQEQILQQAQQASEYETAVQHWKDRSLESEQTVGQMKHVLEHLLCDRNNNEPLSEHQLEDAIAQIAASLPDDRLTDSTRKISMLDLPSIMHRWRSSKS